MEIGLVVLVVLALITWANWTLHYYTQVGTYALFPAIATATSGPGFVAYHKAYERRLPLTIYAPWSSLMLASAAFCVWRPPGIGLGVALTLLVLNGAIAVLSLLLAAPVHRHIDVRGALAADDAARLLRYNGARLAVASLSALLVAAALLIELADLSAR